MKTKLLTLLAISILLTYTTVYAHSKVLLRLDLEKGATYGITMNMTNLVDQEMMGQKIKMDQKMEMITTCKVLDILPNKNFLIDYSVQKMSMTVNVNGKEVANLDSNNQDINNPMFDLLKSLSSLKLKLEMNNRGQVERVEGLDEYAKKLAGNPQMAQSLQMFQNEESFKTAFGQTFNYFPENEVKSGDKWTATFKLPAMMNMETIMNFEVSSIEKTQILLNVVSDINMESPVEQGGMKMNMKMTGTQNGTMTINTKDGWVRESDVNQKFDVKMKMKNPQSGEDMEIPMVMNSVTKITGSKK